jgi:crotonobetainyl-CoA:carnitine CoA-transferase CaiB-like acyl-CoA transferase
MTDLSQNGLSMTLAEKAWTEFGGDPALPARWLKFEGEGALPSAFAVTDVAAASVACAGLALSELLGGAPVTVDRRLTAFWFAWSIREQGWKRPWHWDPIAGDYKTADGWLKLHPNAPAHRAAAMKVLGGLLATREETEAKIATWKSGELEAAIVAAGGACAELRTQAAWAEHPQGKAVAAEPLAHVEHFPQVQPYAWRPTPERPLKGLKVLDLTRILAGPIATRFLAGYGAEVLRVDPPGWDEPGIIQEIALGKRCARLDLKTPEAKARVEELLSEADILMHGYRPGALDALGFSAERRREIRPDLVDVSLCAYGWTGPWAGRRGYDSLMQLSSGIAHTGMLWKGGDAPHSLPVQLLDHATGYFLATSAIRGLAARVRGEGGSRWRLSLARTAKFLTDAGPNPPQPEFAPETETDLAPEIEQTGWGPAKRIKPPLMVGNAPMRWDLGAPQLGTHEAAWAA